MKLEAKCRGETYQIEIRESPDSLPRRRFELLFTQEGRQIRKLSLEVVNRDKGYRLFKIADRIVNLIVSASQEKFYRVDLGTGFHEVEVYSIREKFLRQASRLEMTGTAEIKAEMPGRVIKVLKKTGDPVAAGEGIAVIEAMKMQNEIKAPKTGNVTACQVREGDSVESGALLFRIE